MFTPGCAVGEAGLEVIKVLKKRYHKFPFFLFCIIYSDYCNMYCSAGIAYFNKNVQTIPKLVSFFF